MADCTKTVDFLREWSRMCEGRSCEKCPISPHSVADRTSCNRYVASHPDDAIAIVQKWSDEHPVMTWADKLRELLPDARIIEEIMRTCCPSDVFGSIASTADEGGCKSMGGYTSYWNGEYREK